MSGLTKEYVFKLCNDLESEFIERTISTRDILEKEPEFDKEIIDLWHQVVTKLALS